MHGQQQKPVEPVESADYLDRVKKQRIALLATRDSSMVQLRLARSGFYPAIGSVKITGDQLTLYPANFMSGWLTGSLNTTVEFRQANKQPLLQNAYARAAPPTAPCNGKARKPVNLSATAPRLASWYLTAPLTHTTAAGGWSPPVPAQAGRHKPTIMKF